MALPYKTKVWKKMTKCCVECIRIGYNPIGGGAETCEKKRFCFRKARSETILPRNGTKTCEQYVLMKQLYRTYP